MTSEFEILLKALGKSVFGKEYAQNNTVKCEAVYKIAVSQGVFPLVYPTASFNNTDLKWEAHFLKTVAVNEKKQYYLKKIIESFETENIDCAVLKGTAVASLYNMPECRVSGDIDVYINPDDEKKAVRILENMGMVIKPRQKGGHHFEARSESCGTIEVHTMLYNKEFLDIVLKNKFGVKEPFKSIDTRMGFSIKTLGVEDNLNFLTTHLIKHFVKEGCGIRQVTDLLAYVNFYKDEIDFEKYFSAFSELGFGVFIKNVFGIGKKYFSLDLPFAVTDMSEKILDDIENGGNFGFGDKERKGFYQNFLRRKSNSDKEEFEETLAKKRKKSILKSVFLPGRRILIKKGYSYLSKSIFLYPIAYFHRFFDVAVKLKNKNRSLSSFGYTEASNDVINERVKLMKEMGIL